MKRTNEAPAGLDYTGNNSYTKCTIDGTVLSEFIGNPVTDESSATNHSDSSPVGATMWLSVGVDADKLVTPSTKPTVTINSASLYTEELYDP